MLRMTTTETATVRLSAVHPRLTRFTATVLPIDSRLSDIWPSEQRLDILLPLKSPQLAYPTMYFFE